MEMPCNTLKGPPKREENAKENSHNSSTKFEIGQPVKVKYHAHHTFEPKYLLDYKVLKVKEQFCYCYYANPMFLLVDNSDSPSVVKAVTTRT